VNKWALSLVKNVVSVEQLRMFAGSWFQAEGAATEWMVRKVAIGTWYDEITAISRSKANVQTWFAKFRKIWWCSSVDDPIHQTAQFVRNPSLNG